jgi:hypothetical protein
LLGAPGAALSPAGVAARVDALRSYYPFLDRVLGPLVEPSPDRTHLVVTQPGRVQTSTGGLFAMTPPARDWIKGDLALINTPKNVDDSLGSTPFDVAPTIWWALGLPLSRELAGRPCPALFGNGGGLVDPGRSVARYGRPFIPATRRSGKPLDQEMIDRLRSLGYVK